MSAPSQSVLIEVPFDESTWSFSSTFPASLSTIMSQLEWDSILDHINTEICEDARKSRRKCNRMCKYTLFGSLTVVGALLWPFCFLMEEAHNIKKKRFWINIRKFLSHLNAEERRMGRAIRWGMSFDEVLFAKGWKNGIIDPQSCRCITVESIRNI